MSQDYADRPDEFLSFSELYKIDMELHDEYWKELKKFNFSKIVEKIKKKEKELVAFAHGNCGLYFSEFNVSLSGREKNCINISLSNTEKQDLGFFGNYIEKVWYGMYADGAHVIRYNPVTKQFRMWFNCGVNYSHVGGGSNGVSESNVALYYMINENQFVVMKRNQEGKFV